MPKKLTDKEIVKALECCAVPLPKFKCDECPAWVNSHCTLKTEDIIDLITCLQEDSERLQEAIDEQDIEISRLYKRIDEAKAEAYKEFAERLKRKIYKDIDKQGMLPLPFTKKAYDTVIVFIDNLLKELVGEEK